MWLGCGSDVARVSLGRVFRCGSKGLAEVKGKDVSSRGGIYHERKKHPKKICIKNFGGTLAGGSKRGA